MPKRTSDYVADDFVEDDNTPTGATRNKRGKPTTASESIPSITNARKVKTGKQPVDQALKRDDNGDEYWELSSGGTRRVTVNEFKGNTMVNLREYYEAGGKQLPGKKGISLPLDQFTALVEVLPQIEKALKERGESLPRPNYDAQGVPAAENDDEDGGDGAEKDDGEESGGAKKDIKKKRKNFEATSDEEE